MGWGGRRERQRADAEQVEGSPRCGRSRTLASGTRGKRTCGLGSRRVERTGSIRVTHPGTATGVPSTATATLQHPRNDPVGCTRGIASKRDAVRVHARPGTRELHPCSTLIVLVRAWRGERPRCFRSIRCRDRRTYCAVGLIAGRRLATCAPACARAAPARRDSLHGVPAFEVGQHEGRRICVDTSSAGIRDAKTGRTAGPAGRGRMRRPERAARRARGAHTRERGDLVGSRRLRSVARDDALGCRAD